MKLLTICKFCICFIILVNINACKKEDLPEGAKEESAGNFYFNFKTHNILPAFINNKMNSNSLNLYFYTKYANPRGEGLTIYLSLSGKEEGTYTLGGSSLRMNSVSNFTESYTGYYCFLKSGSICTITYNKENTVSGNFRLLVEPNPIYSNDSIVTGSFNNVTFN